MSCASVSMIKLSNTFLQTSSKGFKTLNIIGFAKGFGDTMILKNLFTCSGYVHIFTWENIFSIWFFYDSKKEQNLSLIPQIESNV